MPTDAEGLPDSFYARRSTARPATQEDRKGEALRLALEFLHGLRNAALRDPEGKAIAKVSYHAIAYQIRKIEETRDGR